MFVRSEFVDVAVCEACQQVCVVPGGCFVCIPFKIRRSKVSTVWTLPFFSCCWDWVVVRVYEVVVPRIDVLGGPLAGATSSFAWDVVAAGVRCASSLSLLQVDGCALKVSQECFWVRPSTGW